jgi:leader peptidase (prepilin peptidase)/N-methyltransferase
VNSLAVNPYLVAVIWAVVGTAAGWFARWGSVRLAQLEGLEPGHKLWQEYGPPILSAIVFAVYALQLTSPPVLILRSLFALVLVQVIFFDFEHHLILDRVIFPAMVLALLVSVFGNRVGVWSQEWWMGILMGLVAGMLFLVIALAGAAIFRAEAMGFGDVKLATFLGLLLGWPYVFSALFYGVVLAAVGAVVYIVSHRSMKGTIAYGPYLAAGALIMLLQLP